MFKILEIWAVLDEEPELNETFIVTLFNPVGGARLGEALQISITILENLAPLSLFRISASDSGQVVLQYSSLSCFFIMCFPVLPYKECMTLTHTLQ